ncbi:hypothetical protein L596_015787 [Steinernema carpocapsae]|uniref:NR LBD domain-containing protein n=1 Tax=Steinernema carpocapsae TaxID=34508 RepID=A0A4U5NH92_STECR|nr:hypothetical protein L596_015787 [Steinernema carpocapsae]
MEKATRTAVTITIRADVPLIIEMLRTSFPPYYNFSSEQRSIYFRNFIGHFFVVDPAYRTSLLFPDENDQRYTMQCEQLYFCIDDMADYYREDSHVDVDEAVRMFSPMFQMIRAHLKEPMVNLGLTKPEMIAVLGLCLLADGKEGASEESAEQCAAARQILYRELFEECKANAGEENVSVRLGTIIGLVPSVMKLSTKFVSKLSIAKLFGIMEFDPKIYNLFPDTI